MTYQRFKLQDTLATVATSATLQADTPPTVAKVASVASTACEDRGSHPQSVATVASPTDVDGAASGASKRLLDDVAIGIERAAAKLKSSELPRINIDAQAAAMVRADLRNSIDLYIPQYATSRCHVCGEPEAPDQPFIAVLSARFDHPHWLHRGDCHDRHIGKIDARVAAVVSDAAPVAAVLQRRDCASAGPGWPNSRSDKLI